MKIGDTTWHKMMDNYLERQWQALQYWVGLDVGFGYRRDYGPLSFWKEVCRQSYANGRTKFIVDPAAGSVNSRIVKRKTESRLSIVRYCVIRISSITIIKT
jgi:hypothetical protein